MDILDDMGVSTPLSLHQVKNVACYWSYAVLIRPNYNFQSKKGYFWFYF